MRFSRALRAIARGRITVSFSTRSSEIVAEVCVSLSGLAGGVQEQAWTVRVGVRSGPCALLAIDAGWPRLCTRCSSDGPLTLLTFRLACKLEVRGSRGALLSPWVPNIVGLSSDTRWTGEVGICYRELRGWRPKTGAPRSPCLDTERERNAPSFRAQPNFDGGARMRSRGLGVGSLDRTRLRVDRVL